MAPEQLFDDARLGRSGRADRRRLAAGDLSRPAAVGARRLPGRRGRAGWPGRRSRSRRCPASRPTTCSSGRRRPTWPWPCCPARSRRRSGPAPTREPGRRRPRPAARRVLRRTSRSASGSRPRTTPQPGMYVVAGALALGRRAPPGAAPASGGISRRTQPTGRRRDARRACRRRGVDHRGDALPRPLTSRDSLHADQGRRGRTTMTTASDDAPGDADPRRRHRTGAHRGDPTGAGGSRRDGRLVVRLGRSGGRRRHHGDRRHAASAGDDRLGSPQRRRHQGPDHDPDRHRLPLGQRRAALRARPLRLPAPVQDLPRRAHPVRQRRRRHRTREHRGPLRRHRVRSAQQGRRGGHRVPQRDRCSTRRSATAPASRSSR